MSVGYGGGLWGGGLWGGSSGPTFVPDADLDAYSVDPGVDAGRVSPATYLAPDGSFVFCLGHDKPGFTGFLKPGDRVDVSAQSSFLSPMNALTFLARLRPPSMPMPTGTSWTAALVIDDVIVSSRSFGAPGQAAQNWATWLAAISSSLWGESSPVIGFRLTFNGPTSPGPYPFYEVEIPAFYVDSVDGSTLSTPYVANMVPEINSGISSGPPPSVDTAIDFDVIDFGTSGIAAGINVDVNGSPAIVSGVAQSGFTAIVTVTGTQRHVRLVPANPFASASTVTVRVRAQTVDTLHSVDTTYSFRVADVVPPTIVAAAAQTTKTVLVTWSEPVLQISPLGADDALNPSLYTFSPALDGVHPAVTPNIVRVDAVNSTTVLLTADIDLSPGISYVVDASNVADLQGNASDTFAAFFAFVPPRPAARVFDLYRKLPEKNRFEDVSQDLLRFILCFQEVVDLLLFDIDNWTSIIDLNVAPEPFLDAMLEDLGNPFPFVLTTIQKRQLLRVLIGLYKQKGTAIGIINAVRFFLGLTVTISFPSGSGSTMQLGVSHLGIDWILGSGQRRTKYSFNVVSSVALTDDQISQITFIAKYMKCAHEHFIGVVVPSTAPTYDPMVLGTSRLGVDWTLH